MARKETQLLKKDLIFVSEINFQYFPSEILPNFYFGGRHIASIESSPHFRFLNDIKSGIHPKKTDYFQWLRWRGKDVKTANSKIDDFVKLYHSIKSSGLNTNIYKSIIVLNEPFILTRYGYNPPFKPSFEIWSGHHRLTIALFLGMEKIRCDLHQDKYPGSKTSKYNKRMSV